MVPPGEEPARKCTAEEIAEKRRIALERQQMVKQQKAGSENKIPPQQTLTAEQRALIEKNRLLALERARRNKATSAAKSEKPPSRPDNHPAKIMQKVNNNRPHPYAKPHSYAGQLLKPQPQSFQQPVKAQQLVQQPINSYLTGTANQILKNKPKTTPLKCLFELISAERFVAKCDYNETVISEFKKIESKNYSE